MLAKNNQKSRLFGAWKLAKNYWGGKILSKNNLPEGKNGARIGRGKEGG